ncbi:MAG: pitrilysin family protein, partial [Pseudomonadota bacterium]
EKTPSKYDRSEPPLGPAPIFRSPDIWDADLANGIKVTGIHDNETPLVSFSLTVPGGRWQDIPGREGAASLLAALSMQGTASKTPAELEQAIGLLGASISFGSSAESFTIYGVTLESNLIETVALLEEMLLKPRWDESEFERLRRSRLAAIIAAQGNANSLARNAFNALLFGRDHPYGKPGNGISESIEALTIDDLKTWHAANLSPAGATLQIVGAADKAQALEAFSQLAKNWQGNPPVSKTYAMGPPPKGETVYFIDLPGAKQSVIRVGKRIMPVTDPEWLRLNYANQRLGSGSSARLTQLLRIEKGYTYGAGSGLGSNLNGPSPWLATTSVRANVTLESMQLIREQIQTYAATFLDEDTGVTKNQTIKRNARSLETLGAKRGLLSRIAQRGAPYNIVELETDVLQSMTTQDFRQVIDRNLNESEMIWVVVGDAATQLERLKDFGYGDVIMLDRQGNLLPPK